MSGDYKPYLLKSTDLGRSWTSIAGNLPNKGTVYAIIDDPVDPSLLFAGTEFGLYFTKNNGQTWTRLRGGLPTIQVRDLAIQRQTNDLVVATFGRSFYVLDDITPLRATTTKTLADESALFPVRRTPLYAPSNFVTPGSNGSQGANVYTAPNPPYGAMVTYFLRNTIRSRREQRQLAERAAARQGRDVFAPSWDSLRVEDREEPPAIELTPISRAIETLARRAVSLDEARAAAAKKGASASALSPIDVRIAQSEQQLLDAAGLVHREWFKHLLYAPGFYTGYAVKTMPGVREAIEQAQYESLPAEIARVAKALEREAAWLDAITRDLRALR
jgi:hypothetical protein